MDVLHHICFMSIIQGILEARLFSVESKVQKMSSRRALHKLSVCCMFRKIRITHLELVWGQGGPRVEAAGLK